MNKCAGRFSRTNESARPRTLHRYIRQPWSSPSSRCWSFCFCRGDQANARLQLWLCSWPRQCVWPAASVETIGSKFGGIPRGLPPFSASRISTLTIFFRSSLPRSRWRCWPRMESMLSAVVADGMTGDRHNPDMELVAQGAANLVSPFLAAFLQLGRSHARPPTFAPAHESPISGHDSCSDSVGYFGGRRAAGAASSRWQRLRRCSLWWPTTWASGTR